jgi:hypothetical protein
VSIFARRPGQYQELNLSEVPEGDHLQREADEEAPLRGSEVGRQKKKSRVQSKLVDMAEAERERRRQERQERDKLKHAKKELTRKKIEASRLDNVDFPIKAMESEFLASISEHEFASVASDLIEEQEEDGNIVAYKDVEKYRMVEDKMRLQAI